MAGWSLNKQNIKICNSHGERIQVLKFLLNNLHFNYAHSDALQKYNVIVGILIYFNK